MNTQLLSIDKKYHTVGGFIFQKGLKKIINAQGYGMGNNDIWLMFVQQPLFKNSLTVMVEKEVKTEVERQAKKVF